MEVTLKDGTILKGDADELSRIIKKIGDTDGEDLARFMVYKSASKGSLLISDMNSRHIQNAICKMYREWAAELNKKPVPLFLDLLRRGPNSPTILGMVEELGKRRSRGNFDG